VLKLKGLGVAVTDEIVTIGSTFLLMPFCCANNKVVNIKKVIKSIFFINKQIILKP
jgi:hypothetical protein